MVKKKMKCPLCDEFSCYDKRDLYNHIEKSHGDSIPADMSVAQYYYNISRNVESGHCIMCKSPTDWNEATGKYKRFCNNPKCKDKYRDIFKKRMIDKYGKPHLLNDPKVQQKMLENRSISGKYEWSDGSDVKSYTGTYELRFLEYCDLVLNLPSDDVMCPSPFVFCYTLTGKVPQKAKYFTEDEYDTMNDIEKNNIADSFLLYRPDAYIPSINMVIEIKHGGDNPNMHPKIQAVDVVKDKAKAEVMKNQKTFNFMKISGNNYGDFITYFANLRYYEEQINRNNRPNVIIGEGYGDVNENTIYITLLEYMDKELIGISKDSATSIPLWYTGEHTSPSNIFISNSTSIRVGKLQINGTYQDIEDFIKNQKPIDNKALDVYIRSLIDSDNVPSIFRYYSTRFVRNYDNIIKVEPLTEMLNLIDEVNAL